MSQTSNLNTRYKHRLSRDKQQVARQFSRAANSYDKAASIQQQTASHLLTLLKQHRQFAAQYSGHWLDIGCGTGASLEPLLATGIEHISGVDLAEGMLNYAQQRFADSPLHTQLEYVQADADTLPFHYGSKRGIFSSLMLQWSEQPQATLAEWHRVLENQGILALATLLPGTQKELIQAWQQVDQHPHVNQFVPEHYLQALLNHQGFEVVLCQQQCLSEHYQSLPSLLRSLKAIGATNVNAGRKNGLGGRYALQQLDKHYPREHTNGQLLLPVSYQICWILARKAE